MFFPMLKKIGLEKMTVTDFPGLDRRETARIGGFREMRNLCGEGYPTLRTRQARGLTATVTKPGGLTAKDALIWVDGTRICVNGEAAGPVLTEGEKDLISMGAYLIVFPDKVYLNTKDLTDYGSLECERTASAGVAISLCDAEGKAYSGVVQSVGAPEDPEEGTLWMDVSGAEPVLRQYGQECWTALQNVCVKLQATLLGKGFAAGDGVTGVNRAKVLVLGGGTVGEAAARMATGLGADVWITDISLPRLRQLQMELPINAHTLYSNEHNIRKELPDVDIVVGSVLVPGDKAPHLITRDMLKLMEPGTVLVDVAIDQGGCFETSHPTTHSDPTFMVDGIVHYAVANIPGAVPHTSTIALTNATLKYALALADKGWQKACKEDKALYRGLNIVNGKVVFKAVADVFGLEYEEMVL